jgi:hypothetical protein
LNPTNASQRVVYFGAPNLVDLPLLAPIASLKRLGKLGGTHAAAVASQGGFASAQATRTASAEAPGAGQVIAIVPTNSLEDSGDGSSASSTGLASRKRPTQGTSKGAWLGALDALYGS